MAITQAQSAEIEAQRGETQATRRAVAPALEEILYQALPVLDHGFVRVVDYMGDDGAVVQAARVSYGRGTKRVSEDRGLINYLMRHRHTTPFEMAEIKYHVKLPVFVARQWIRHRTANVNEYSARYSILDNEFYIPAPEHLAAQSTVNRQGRGEVLEGAEAQRVLDLLRQDAAAGYAHYTEMLNEDDDGNALDPSRRGLARELARLERAGAAPHAALVRALEWSHDRLEFGMSHAQAAAAEWLRLGGRRARSAPKRLAVRLEAVSHLAWDVRREPAYPYPAGADPFAPEALVAAIEAEDEAGAVRQARGALSSGHGFAPLEAPLTRAALAHYQDFGHALIYVYKARLLAEQVGAAAAETVVLPLVRMLIYCRREDLIPEFRHYAPALAAWDGGGGGRPAAEDFRGLTVKRALALAVRASGDPAALYQALLGAAAWNFLHFDLDLERQSDNPVSRNVGWLDVTHAVTFANAVRVQCGRHPELWPQGLLQLACFVGRNAGFVDAAVDARRWRVAEPRRFLDAALDGLFDHGQREHIVAAHLLKTLMAVDEEFRAAPEAPWRPTLLAAVNRFLNSPLRRRHVARTAKQALAFVAQES